MNVSPDRRVSRRRFLAMTAVIGAGTVGAGTLLAACGGGDRTGDGKYDPEDLSVMQRFSSTGLVPGDVRLPVSLANKSQILDDAATAAYAGAKLVPPRPTTSPAIFTAESCGVIHVAVCTA